MKYMYHRESIFKKIAAVRAGWLRVTYSWAVVQFEVPSSCITLSLPCLIPDGRVWWLEAWVQGSAEVCLTVPPLTV